MASERDDRRLEYSWRICLFGGLEARRDGHTVTHFGTRKTGALLAFLAYHLQRSHPREVLAELLWPDENARVELEDGTFLYLADLDVWTGDE